jgi:hypothetical protein
MKTALTLIAALLLLTACASSSPPPDWKASAFSALHEFSSAHLSGNTRLADLEFSRAQAEISRTGRLDLMARAELTRCAVYVASLDWAPCTAFDAYAKEATTQEKAYATFLTSHWEGLNPELLPVHYRNLVLQSTTLQAQGAPAGSKTPASLLQDINDPLARLIAASVLLKRQQLQTSEWPLVTDTASAQGWRRPLLAWLGLELKSAQATGMTEVAETLQRRIQVVLQSNSKSQ